MSKVKKTEQLGMNPSTASGRLVKDLLFSMAKELGHKCFQCGGELCRETFSVEHKQPWLDSDDPVKLYFDLTNIAFSHKSCNFGAARNTKIPPKCGTSSRYDSSTYRCRCSACKEAKSLRMKAQYENRSDRKHCKRRS